MFTNVSSDHLDLQGIHTLARARRGQGDDLPGDEARRLGRPQRRRPVRGRRRPSRARRASRASRSTRTRRRSSPATAGPAAAPTSSAAGSLRRVGRRRRARDRRRSPTCRSRSAGLARHNVANALAAAGGARALGDVDRAGRRRAARLPARRPSLSPGRMNLFRLGQRTVIVDFAHNEAGTEAILDVAAAIAGGAAGPGGAGHRDHRHRRRPAGRHAARASGGSRPTKAQRVAIKETLDYLRGRDAREHHRRRSAPASPRAAWTRRRCPSTRPRRRPSRRSSSGSSGAASTNGRADAPRVVVLFCHAEREDVFALLDRLGARQVDARRRPRGTSRRASRTSAAADQRAAARSAPPRSEDLAVRRLELARVGERGPALRATRRASSPPGTRRPRRRRTRPRGRPAPRAAARPAPPTPRRGPSRPSSSGPGPRPVAALTPAATLVAVSPGRRPRRFASSRMRSRRTRRRRGRRTRAGPRRAGRRGSR